MQAASVKLLGQQPRQVMRFAPYILIGIIFIVMPPLMPVYVQSLMTKILIFAIFAISLDLAIGYTGLLTLGHSACFGAAAYTVGVLAYHYQVNSLWVGMSLAILIAVAVAAIFGVIALRVTGFYFLFVTFALAQLLYSITWKWTWLSSAGIEGIAGIMRPDTGVPGFTWTFASYYYFVLTVLAICYFLLNRLVNSPFGYALRGIRDSEPRMRVLGYNTWFYQYLSFVIAGLFSGVAGALLAYHNGIVTPENVGITVAALGWFIVVLGGQGTLYGPVIGAAIIIPLEFFAGVLTPQRWPLILGSAFVLSIMFARQGVGVYIYRAWRKVVNRYGSIKS